MVIASTAASVLAFEIGLRIGGYEPRGEHQTPIGRERIKQPFPDVRYVFRGYSHYTQVWPSNPRGYFDTSTNGLTYSTNNFGFRDGDFSLSRTEAIRIAFLGDSMCWGIGVRREHSFPYLIERHLNQAFDDGGAIEVYNFALPGFNTVDQVALYEHVVRHFRPDVIVVWYFLNDINIPGRRFVPWRARPDPSWLREWRTRSRLLDLVVARMKDAGFERSLRRRINEAHSPGSEGRQSIEQGLQRLRFVAESDRTKCYLVVVPWLVALEESSYPFFSSHEAVRSIAEERGFVVFDLFPHLARFSAEELWVHRVDHHLNELGHEAVSSAFGRFFERDIGGDWEALLGLALTHSSLGRHPMDGTVPSDWPIPFAESVSRTPLIPTTSEMQPTASKRLDH